MTNVMNFALAATLLISQTVNAQIVISESGDDVRFDNATDGTFSPGSYGGATAITPHSLWQDNNPLGRSAVWISFANTGVGGDTLALQNTTMTPIMEVRETMLVSGILDLDVWADDTAQIFLNGAALLATNGASTPNFTQNVCADGSLGCEPDEFARFSQMVMAGDILTILAYQTGSGTTTNSNPFGLLYSGEVTAVPEPSTYAVMGGALALAALARRRRTA